MNTARAYGTWRSRRLRRGLLDLSPFARPCLAGGDGLAADDASGGDGARGDGAVQPENIGLQRGACGDGAAQPENIGLQRGACGDGAAQPENIGLQRGERGIGAAASCLLSPTTFASLTAGLQIDRFIKLR